jgi:hypothetical protein
MFVPTKSQGSASAVAVKKAAARSTATTAVVRITIVPLSLYWTSQYV